MLNFVTHGRGEEVVVGIHDMASDHSEYEGLVNYLDTKHFRYIFPDLRGYGLSKNIPGEYTLDEVVSDLNDVLDREGVERAHFIGHSMSGMFMQAYAIGHPGRVLSLIGTCPVPPIGYPGDEEIYNMLLNSFVTRDSRRMLMQEFLGEFYGAEWAKFKADYWWETTASGASEGYLRTIQHSNIEEAVLKLECPQMILLGELDNPPLTADIVRASPLGQKDTVLVEELEGCSHYPHQERPPYLAAHYNRFLASVKVMV